VSLGFLVHSGGLAFSRCIKSEGAQTVAGRELGESSLDSWTRRGMLEWERV